MEPTDKRANPKFKNAATCVKWLAQMQFTNLQVAQAALRAELDDFNRFPARGLERLQTLEALRETVHHVQADYAKKLFARPLPLATAELALLAAINGLWQAMANGYLRCLQDYQAGDSHLAQFGALLCHRGLLYHGMQIIEHLRVGYDFDGQLWRQLHGLYTFAEEQGLLTALVTDELSEHERRSSCHAIYVKTLLACRAKPEELSRNQQQWMNRWLTSWAPAMVLERTYGTYAVSKGDAPTLAIDLDSAAGLQSIGPALPENGNIRYLPMVPMSKLLRVKTILLQQGQSPRQLELGEGCETFDCAELLSHLHKCWCEAPIGRSAARQAASKQTQLCYGLEGIHSYIADRTFRLPKKNAAFALGYPEDTCEVEDESVLGARLLRAKLDSERLSANQIVACRAAGTKSFTIGVTAWVSVKRTGELHMGLRYLPGTPQAISVKSKAATPEAPSVQAALLLPAMAELNIPSSLIIPRNVFQAGATLEVTFPDGKKMNAKMRFSVERGVDYERISYAPA